MSEERESAREASRLTRKRHPINACKAEGCKEFIEWQRTEDGYESEGTGPYFGYCENRDGGFPLPGVGCGRKADPADYPIAKFPDFWENLHTDTIGHHYTEHGADACEKDDAIYDADDRRCAVWYSKNKHLLTKYVRGANFQATIKGATRR